MKKSLLLFALLTALPIVALAQGTTWQEATLIENGKTIRCEISKDTPDEWFKLEVPDDGVAEFSVTPSPAEGSSLWLNQIDLNWKDGDKMSRRQLTNPSSAVDTKKLTVADAGKGTYYLHIHCNSGRGYYDLTYTYTPSKYRNDNSDNDEGGKGDLIADGATVQGHLGYRDASNYRDMEDWYWIEVPQDGKVEFNITPEPDCRLWLHELSIWRKDGDSMTKLKSSNHSAVIDTKTISLDGLSKGRYYFRIHNEGGGYAQGGYDLTYNFTPCSFPSDPEPNDVAEQATPIRDGQTLTARLGYTDGNGVCDAEDWFRVDGHPIMLTITYEQIEDGQRLNLDKMYLAKKTGDEMKVTTGIFNPGTNITYNLKFENLDENGEYYICLHRKGGANGYKLTVGAPERVKGSNIRVSCVNSFGTNSTRLGIPSNLLVKVENVSADSTGSFFVALPCTPNIEILHADIPTPEGTVRYQHDDFAINDPDEGDCAVFIMPNLGPYESYRFTICTQGRVDSQSRSDAPMNRTNLSEKTAAYFAALKSAEKKVEDNFEWRAVGEDGLSVATTQACIDAFIFTKEEREQYSKVIGLTEREYKTGYRKPQAYPVLHYTTKVAQNLNPVIAGFNTLKASGQIANSLVNAIRRKVWLWIYKDLGYVQDDPQIMDGRTGIISIVRSWDPNEMVGPAGVGDKNYIAETRTMDYRIMFENKKEATAPAYRIRISDELDENVFDVSTVRFGDTSHDGAGYNWKMTRDGNRLSWDIEGIELPPNVNAPEGEGYVSFSVDLKPGLKSGTQLKNKAAIIFDYNETIWTNEYVNTLDLAAPQSSIKEHSVGADNTVTVRCTGSDAESGISHYLFYGSANGGEYQYMGQSQEPEFSFKQDPNTVIDIKVLAVDNVGNTQSPSATAYTVGIEGVVATQATVDGWTVYRMDGTVVARGKGMAPTKLPAGIYIIYQGDKPHKVVMK